VSRCSPQPFDVELCGEVRTVLERRASSRCEPHAIVVRARIVLMAADGARNVDIPDKSVYASMSCRSGVNDSVCGVCPV